MDENVLSTFALDEAKAFSPLNHFTVPVIRSDIVFASLGHFKNLGVLFSSIGGQNKTTHVSNREPLVFVLPTRTYCYPTSAIVTDDGK